MEMLRAKLIVYLAVYLLLVFIFCLIPPAAIDQYVPTKPLLVGDILSSLVGIGVLPVAIWFATVPLLGLAPKGEIWTGVLMVLTLSCAAAISSYVLSPVPYKLSTVGWHFLTATFASAILFVVLAVIPAAIASLFTRKQRRDS
jgi:hypothetical protein